MDFKDNAEEEETFVGFEEEIKEEYAEEEETFVGFEENSTEKEETFVGFEEDNAEEEETFVGFGEDNAEEEETFVGFGEEDTANSIGEEEFSGFEEDGDWGADNDNWDNEEEFNEEYTSDESSENYAVEDEDVFTPYSVQSQDEIEEVDESFDTYIEADEETEGYGVGIPTSNKNVRGNTLDIPREEVDVAFTEDISAMEQGYQDEANKPKIVEKIVEKEVIRTVGGSDVVNSILSGKTHKVVLFTGDRQSGVTTSALILAKQFAQKVPVLYFDVDTNRHGLMSYIEYKDFQQYDPVQRDGIKRCKSDKVFDSCLCYFSDNLDILTTDYTTEVSGDDIEACQSVVAERVQDYGLVVIDCPIENLQYIVDLILISNTVVCANGSRTGIMNLICSMADSGLNLKYRRNLISTGVMFATHVNNKGDLQDAVNFGDEIYNPEGDCNYLGMPIIIFNGKYNKGMLTKIFDR